MKDSRILVVACSDTESTSGSVVVKNGLSALRYLKLVEGKNSEPLRKIENIIMEKASMVNNILRLGLPLKVLTINNKTIISVGIINPNPPKLVIKSIPGLSKLIVVKIVDVINSGIDQKRNFVSFLKKGNDITKRPIGITKN